MTTKTQTKKPTPPAKTKKSRTFKRATSKPGKKLVGPKKAPAQAKTKKAIIRNLLEQPDGASIDELTRATKWQSHSVRAALTGLRKAGSDVARTKDDGGITRYRIGGGQ